MYQLMGKRIRWTSLALAVCLLSACGGSSGDKNDSATDDTPDNGNQTTDTITLSGTVATGAPFAGTVSVTDADGTTYGEVTIDQDGEYTIEVSDEPPYLLKALGTDGSTALYSWADSSAAITNITELTTLAVSEALAASGQSIDSIYANWEAYAQSVSQEDIDAAVAAINEALTAYMTAAGINPEDYDFFSESFEPNGEGIDAVLDQVEVVVDGNSVTVTDGQGNTIDISVDTGGGVTVINIPEGSTWSLTVTTVDPTSGQVVTIPAEMLSDYVSQPPISEADFNAIFSSVSADYAADFENLDIQYNVTYAVSKQGDLSQVGDQLIWTAVGTVSLTTGGEQLTFDTQSSYIWTRQG
jgi:hypothetical protein